MGPVTLRASTHLLLSCRPLASQAYGCKQRSISPLLPLSCFCLQGCCIPPGFPAAWPALHGPLPQSNKSSLGFDSAFKSSLIKTSIFIRLEFPLLKHQMEAEKWERQEFPHCFSKNSSFLECGAHLLSFWLTLNLEGLMTVPLLYRPPIWTGNGHWAKRLKRKV